MGDGTSPRRRRFSLHLRAVLAGGLVLGVGGTVTLASWNDSEYASGSFMASVFNTESAVQGGVYTDNSTAPGPTLTFGGAGFAPGVSGYFPVLIRTKANSVDGRVVLDAATLGGADAATLGAAFVYRVVHATGTCDATAFTGSSPVFIVGGATTYRALTVGQEVGVTNILSAATATLPGAPTGFCFEVTLPAGAANSLQGKTATATWQFVATSS